MKLLIVEDEPNLLSIIRKGLSEKNYDVSAALDGATALQMIAENVFDVIVLDVMLPDIHHPPLTYADTKENNHYLHCAFVCKYTSSMRRGFLSFSAE